MLSILGFLVVLAPLVIVHELGHFLFARLFGVRAEVFAVGFGPKLWGKQIGETEWRVSAIPLGGYVKLLGEDGERELSEEEQKRSLTRQARWKRFFIFFGGPLFNFIFAIFVFMAILAIGEDQLASVVGRVVRGSPAAQAGFVSGDKILSVARVPVKKFDEVIEQINAHPGRPVEVEVLHPNSTNPVTLTVTPSSEEGFSVYGESEKQGEVEGLIPSGRSTRLGISDPTSLAAKVGLKTGDEILEVNGNAIQSWEELEGVYAALPVNGTLQMKLKEGDRVVELSKPIGEASLAQDFGLHSAELFVQEVVADSPAQIMGIQKGDRLISVGGTVMESFFDLRKGVQSMGTQHGKVAIQWERNGKLFNAATDPTATTTRDPVLKKKTQYTIGVAPMLEWAPGVMIKERILNPFKLVYEGTVRMVTFSWRNLVSISKMFSGDVSVKTLGGPILIGKIAGESLARGLISLLTTMAILSVGLGVLNILPIPVLDGGHILLLAVEAIRGRPLTLRQMEIVQQVGLSLILILMVVVMRNDLARLSLFN